MAARAVTEVKVHDTPQPIYEALARVFDEQSRNGHHWVTFDADGVSVTMIREEQAVDDVRA